MMRLLMIGFLGSLTLWLLRAGSEADAGSLYRCVTESEGTIYTDNPAQLQQCAPITASGAVTSLATGSSDSPPAGTPPNPSPMTQTPPEPTVVMTPPGPSPQTIDMPPLSTGPTAPPCPVGINPLNPLSAPPCPTAESIPATPITMPSGQDASPSLPTLP